MNGRPGPETDQAVQRVEAAQRALLLQARAFGESSQAFSSTWNDIATNATLREE
jgi:hypothetical protein